MDKAKTNAIVKKFQAGDFGPVEAARRLSYVADNMTRARVLLKARYDKKPTRKVLEEFGNVSLMMGQHMDAEMAYMSCLLKFGELHVSNLIYTGYPATMALVDDQRKVLYVPIPKCASSTTKNFFSAGLSGETHEEFVHFRLELQNRLVRAEDLTTKYAGYFKFAVVRDPVERVASYYYRNIVGGALTRDAFGRNVIDGMGTVPSIEGTLGKFDAFRRMFLDFRHHTDPMMGYLGPLIGHDPEFQIYSMGGVETVRERLQDIYKTKLPEMRVMSSKGSADDFAEAVKKLEPLRKFFDKDEAHLAEIYGQADSREGHVIAQPVARPEDENWLSVGGAAQTGKSGILEKIATKPFWRK